MPTIKGINSTMQRYENKYKFFSVVILFIVKYNKPNRAIKNKEMGIDKYFSAFFTIEGLETELNVRITKIIKKNKLDA
jgi:hypothetical protein